MSDDISTLRRKIRDAENKRDTCNILKSKVEEFIEELETLKNEVTGETAIKGDFSQKFFEDNPAIRQVSDYEDDLKTSHEMFKSGYSAGFDSFDFFNGTEKGKEGIEHYLKLIKEDLENIKGGFKSLVEKMDSKIGKANAIISTINSEISGINRSISSWSYQISELEKSSSDS